MSKCGQRSEIDVYLASMMIRFLEPPFDSSVSSTSSFGLDRGEFEDTITATRFLEKT